MKTAIVIAAALLASCHSPPKAHPKSTIVCVDAATGNTTYANDSDGAWYFDHGDWHSWDGGIAYAYMPSRNERCAATNQ